MHLRVSLIVDVPATATLPELEAVIHEAGQPTLRRVLGQAVRAYRWNFTFVLWRIVCWEE